SGLVDAGDTIPYSFTVTNNGDVALTRITIDDPLLASVTCAPSELGLGESATCTPDAAYVITESDEAAGEIVNTATATGADPDGVAVQSAESSTTTEVGTPTPVLTLVKSAAAAEDVNDSGRVDPGDTIAFTFTVTNDGNVPVTEVTIADPLIGDVTCEATELAVGATAACVADAAYVITEQDQLDGVVVNTATAGAVDPDGGEVTSPQASVSVLVDAAVPSLALAKTASLDDLDDDELGDVGEDVVFDFTVTNTGQTDLRNIRIIDPMLTDRDIAITCEDDSLAEGASLTCTARYPITDADLEGDVQVLRNVASATATGVGDVSVTSGPSVAVVPLAEPAPEPTPDPGPIPGPGPTPGPTPPDPDPAPSPAPGSPLPRTGSEVLPLVGLTALLLFGGAAMVASTRRRRVTQADTPTDI
ncbi:MAG: hypothetical protein WBG57_04205, partial [Ornithinimicrobium sp.]